ncbi:MAG: hypothetical protein IPK80_02420 [Nannocystis sp.]|nr:hypothetical protein [Nannocystis sp.]
MKKQKAKKKSPKLKIINFKVSQATLTAIDKKAAELTKGNRSRLFGNGGAKPQDTLHSGRVKTKRVRKTRPRFTVKNLTLLTHLARPVLVLENLF